MKGHYAIYFRSFSIKDFGKFDSWLLKEEVLKTSALKAKKVKPGMFHKDEAA